MCLSESALQCWEHKGRPRVLVSCLKTEWNWSLQLPATAPDREIVFISPPSENLHFSQETCVSCEVWQVHWEPLWFSATAALVLQATTCSCGAKTQLLPLSLSAGIGVSRHYRWQFLSFVAQTGFCLKTWHFCKDENESKGKIPSRFCWFLHLETHFLWPGLSLNKIGMLVSIHWARKHMETWRKTNDRPIHSWYKCLVQLKSVEMLYFTSAQQLIPYREIVKQYETQDRWGGNSASQESVGQAREDKQIKTGLLEKVTEVPLRNCRVRWGWEGRATAAS